MSVQINDRRLKQREFQMLATNTVQLFSGRTATVTKNGIPPSAKAGAPMTSTEIIRWRAPREGGKQRRARAFLAAEAGENCIAELPPSEATAKRVTHTQEAPWVITAAAEAKALAEAPPPIVPLEVAVPWWRAAASLVRERPALYSPAGNAQRRARASERRELLALVIGEADSTLLDPIPENDE
jgi:hypothetical protein